MALTTWVLKMSLKVQIEPETFARNGEVDSTDDGGAEAHAESDAAAVVQID